MDTPQEKTLLRAVIVFILNPEGTDVWLATKAGKIGAGCLNGYGGGIEFGETARMCAVREPREECGVELLPEKLVHIAIVSFHNTKSDGSIFTCEADVYLYYTNQIPEASVEMLDPMLFPINGLPLHRLMPADPFWLPLVFQGRKFIATAHYGPKQKELIGEVKIEYVEELPER